MAKAYPLRNMVKAQLRAAITNLSTAVTLNLPSAPWREPSPDVGPLSPGAICLLDDLNNPTKFEVIEYTSYTVSVDGEGAFIVLDGLTRGADGTDAQSFSIGAAIIQAVTSSLLQFGAVGALVASANTEDEAKAAAGLSNAGYLDAPVETASAGFTLSLADRGEIKHKTGTTAFTATIPNNSTVAFANGAQVDFVNSASAGNLTIGIGVGVTLIKAGTGSVASINVLPFGKATATKVATNTWIVDGLGIS